MRNVVGSNPTLLTNFDIFLKGITMKFTIENKELSELNGNKATEFPKYTSQIINWANQNAHGTRPKVIGQLSELFPEYEKSCESISVDGWKDWYLEKCPGAIENAADKIFAQIEALKAVIALIDKDMVRRWVEDLVIAKTYSGLYIQEAILSKVGKEFEKPYRLATPEEEAQGIDGYVGEIPYSIKPDTYKAMQKLPETISVKMIYYTKSKTGLTIEVES